LLVSLTLKLRIPIGKRRGKTGGSSRIKEGRTSIRVEKRGEVISGLRRLGKGGSDEHCAELLDWGGSPIGMRKKNRDCRVTCKCFRGNLKRFEGGAECQERIGSDPRGVKGNITEGGKTLYGGGQVLEYNRK